MTNTALGRVLARLLMSGRLTIDEVKPGHKQDVKDSFKVLYKKNIKAEVV